MSIIEPGRARAMSAPSLRITIRRSHISFVLACVFGVIGLASIIFAPSNGLLALLTLVLLPLALFFLLTGRVIEALTLVWINEMFFGGIGHWISFGPIPARWMLLVILVVAGGAQTFLFQQKWVRDSRLKRPQFMAVIIFYGAIFPLWLVFYSVVGQGTPFWEAVKDVNFLFALLAYFPLRLFIMRQFNLLQGWLIGAVLVLAALFLATAFAPPDIGRQIFQAIAGENKRLPMTASGINRAAVLTQVLLFIGFFLGSLYALNARLEGRKRIGGAALALVSVSPLVLFFLRGPLLSLTGVIALFGLATIRQRQTRRLVIRLGLALVLLATSALALYTYVVPEGLAKFSRGQDGFSAFVADVRIEQAREMMAAFWEEPVLGQGVGVPLILPSRGPKAKISFELQYHMLLYRLGIVNFLVLTLPILWFFLELFRSVCSKRQVLFRRDGKFMMAILLTLLTTLIVGAVNPYLTTSFTPFFVILYLSGKELVSYNTDRQII